MRRLLVLLLLVAATGAIAVLGTGAGGDSSGTPKFKVEVDNAFGLITGGDFKVAGVRAGKITDIELDQRTKRAIVGFTITETGFGSLRADTQCEILPQSLVGEYYVDCQPGTDKRELEPGATIPVEQTSSTVPPDLVGNIMRRPQRERLRFILGELGAGVAGNADNLNAALRRASPALRQTNRVLAILARQNEVLADLATNADRVVGDLAAKRKDVTRFVTEARDTATVSASRDRDIARGFERLPEFLRQLRPTMAELEATVEEQGPAVRNLADSSGQISRLFDNLQPFAKESRPGIRALSRSSDVGREAMRAARPTVAELNRYSAGVPELGKNLAIILEHLDDRDFSAEEDPRSPGGKGYTGLEALLQYVFDQTMATNIHDGVSHILKVFPFEGQCAEYADIKIAREVGKDCSTQLGPNVVGLTFPDKTAPPGFDGDDHGPESGPEEDPRPPGRRAAPRDADGNRVRAVKAPGLDEMLPGRGPDPAVPEIPRPEPPLVSALPDLSKPAADRPPSAAPSAGTPDAAQGQLLDYLLGS